MAARAAKPWTMRGRLLAAAMVWAAATTVAAAQPSWDAGTTYTAGSYRYHRLSLFADVEGTGPLRPYGWADYDVDSYVDMFSLGAGAWKDLGAHSRVKAGLGFNVGNVKAAQGTDSAFVFETGLEKDFSWPTLGAQYRLTAGTIGGPSGPSAFGRSLAMHGTMSGAGSSGMGGMGGGGAASEEVASYAYNEVSGYARFPIGKTRLSLKLSLGAPSYAASIKDETIVWKFPALPVLWVTTAVTAEQQSSASRAYFSAGAYYVF